MVPCDEILQEAIDQQGRHHRPERPDHAVARRNGVVAQRDAAPRHDAAAADRRRDDQPAAYGREDRAGVLDSRPCTCPMPRAWSMSSSSLLSRRQRAGVRARRTGPSRTSCASSTARAGIGRRCPYADARRQPADSSTSLRARGARRSPALRQVDVDLDELVPFIDWTFFFAAWELKGRFPAILDDPQIRRGGARPVRRTRRSCSIASSTASCCARAASMASGRPTRTATIVVLLTATEAGRPRQIAARFPMLRQQEVIADDKPNRSLADFVAPIESGCADYVGAFAVTAGIGVDDLVRIRGGARRLLRDHRQGARRSAGRGVCRIPARAGAHGLGLRRRRALSNDDLIDEKYRGIRPAFGYPACPDHSEKRRLFDAARRAQRPAWT